MRRDCHRDVVTAELDRTLAGAALFEPSLEADHLKAGFDLAFETNQQSEVASAPE